MSVKALIELSTSFEEADAVIEKHVKLTKVSEKIEFVKKVFGYEVVDNQTNDEDDYLALLTAIIEEKWR